MSPIIKHLGVRSRAGRWLTVGVAAAVVAAGVGIAAAPAATAQDTGQATTQADTTQWTTPPYGATAGNFLDLSVGGQTLDSLLKLAYARADYDGTTDTQSSQNPLDVKVLNAIDLPLTGLLQFPGLLGIKLGTVNQVAAINTTDGSSYGGSGAVANSGAISVGGNNNSITSSAEIDLSPSAIMGGSAGALGALGGITLKLEGLAATAQTSAWGKAPTGDYTIADITLSLSSPLLGQLLSPVTSALTGILGSLTGQIGKAAGNATLPNSCASGLSDNSLSIAGGTITIDPANAAITVSLEKLLESLHLDLNNLPPNTSLIGYLINYLTDPSGLIGGLIDTVTNLFGSCTSSVTSAFSGVPILGDLLNTLSKGLNTTTSTLSDITKKLASNSGIGATISNALKPLLAIGVNVQSGGPAGTFQSAFKQPNLPKQGMTPPAGHKGYDLVERAIEVDILGGALSLGLANAAASTTIAGVAAQCPSTQSWNSDLNKCVCPGNAITNGDQCVQCPEGSTADKAQNVCLCPNGDEATQAGDCANVLPETPTHKPHSPQAMPTGVNAGQGTTGGMPTAPLILLIVGLMLAGGGAAAWKLRGAHSSHLG